MKKVLLALSLAVGFGVNSHAQSLMQSSDDMEMDRTNADQKAIINKAENRFRKANQSAKVAGGPVSQYMSHVDIAEVTFGAVLDNYISPIFQDSTVLQDFGTPEYVDNHGYGAIFDVYSQAFALDNVDYFAKTDNYTLDSVLIGGFYEVLNNKTAAYTGDTLVVDIVYGAPSNTAMFHQLQWPANTWSNQPNAQPFSAIAFNGSPAQGYAGDVAWGQKVTLKKALTPADSAIGYHALYSNLQIPAGSVVGVAVRFKSGEAYNTGDVYFAGSGSSSTATMNSFRVLITGPAQAGDNTAYFFENLALGVPESAAGSGPLFTSSRYATTSSGNGYFLNQGSLSADWWIHVTGNSSISIEEEKLASNMKLYPNPTSGNVTLEIAQGGTFQLEVLNMVGAVVYSEVVNINGGEKFNRDFSNLTKGVYLINLRGEGVSNTAKLTIQ